MTKLATLEATLEAIYPVGSVYATIDDNFDPNVSFRGTWERIKPGHTLWSADSGGGQYLAPGLPNIYGNVGAVLNYENLNVYTGPFKQKVKAGSWTSGHYQFDHLIFDASLCSKIYKNNFDTVRPPSFVVNVWLRTA